MANILCLETSTDICSVALTVAGKLPIVEEGQQQKSHAAEIIALIQSCLEKADLEWSGLSALAVSSGPGSFTGLRVGAATAKGICLAHNLPLISVDTLQSLANSVAAPHHSVNSILVLLHARKQEVYAQLHDDEGAIVRKLEVLDLAHESIEGMTGAHADVTILTDCYELISPMLNGRRVIGVVPHAKHLCGLAQSNFHKKVFVNLSSYNPMYVKAPYITTPKKSI